MKKLSRKTVEERLRQQTNNFAGETWVEAEINLLLSLE